MLRQPTWQRVWSELKSDWRIKQKLAERNTAETVQEPIRVGIVGLGRVARRHVYGYLHHPGVVLVAGADPSPKARAKAEKRFGLASTHATTEEMFAAAKLDVVSICSPPRYHAADVQAAADAGVKGILCEKPFGLNLSESDAMLHRCAEKQVVLSINHQRRYGPQHVLAHEILNQGKLGKIQMVYADCPRDILRAGIHVADMLNDYLGRAQRVTASLSNGKGGPARALANAVSSGETTDKESTILVRYANETVAVLQVENRSGLDAKLRFLGEKGVMEVWWDGGLRYRLSGDAQWTLPPVNYTPYFDEFISSTGAVIDAVKNKSQVALNGVAGRNSLELILAILQANDTGESVALAPNENEYQKAKIASGA